MPRVLSPLDAMKIDPPYVPGSNGRPVFDDVDEARTIGSIETVRVAGEFPLVGFTVIQLVVVTTKATVAEGLLETLTVWVAGGEPPISYAKLSEVGIVEMVPRAVPPVSSRPINTGPIPRILSRLCVS